MKYFMLFISVIFLSECSVNESPLTPVNQQTHFGIYFLKDSLLTEYLVREVAIEKLVPDDEPWLNDKDIEYYDFSSHCIYLKKDINDLLNYYKGVYHPLSYFIYSKPFVVTAGSKKCYVGAFHSLVLSSIPIGPYISKIDTSYYPKDVLYIEKAPGNGRDIRNDENVKDYLLRNNKYHAGLEIELKSIKMIENSDTSEIEYSIRIKNNDSDDLMIIDPDKMGSGLFHYFTNGPYFYDANSSKIYGSYQKAVISPLPYDSCDKNWFTLIKSNQFIERTIRLKGYEHLPTGKYNCIMNFADPTKVPKNNRLINGIRIWLGQIESNSLSVVL